MSEALSHERQSIQNAVNHSILPSYETNSLIVHPQHGVGRIKAFEERSFGSTSVLVYVIEIIGSGLTVMVPEGRASEIGLRRIMNEANADEIFREMSKHEMAVQGSSWNRRFRTYNEMLASGASLDIARVLRDMHRLKSDKRLSFGEQRLFDVSRNLLLQELALAKSETPEIMAIFIDKIFEK